MHGDGIRPAPTPATGVPAPAGVAYVPVLRADTATLLALLHVDRAGVDPVLELPDGAPVLVHPNAFRAAADGRPLRIDVRPSRRGDAAAALGSVVDRLAGEVTVAPVVRPGDDLDLLRLAGAFARAAGSHPCLRITRDAPAGVAAITGACLALGTASEEVDLVIDAGAVTSGTWDVLGWVRTTADLAGHRPWRSVSVVGASVPVVPAAPVRERYQPRPEGRLWRATGGRAVGFGDHGTVGRLGAGLALRYATGRSWFVSTTHPGLPVEEAARELSMVAVTSNRYSGEHGSWGDAQFLQVAEHRVDVDDPVVWYAMELSHHLGVMTRLVGAGRRRPAPDTGASGSADRAGGRAGVA